MIDFLNSPWPWYVGGPILGLTVPALLLLTGRQLGLALGYKAICSPFLGKRMSFFNYDWKRDIWRLIFLLGIAIGGFLGGVVWKNPQPPVVAPATVQDLQQIGIHDFSAIQPPQLFDNAEAANPAVILFLMVGGFLIAFGARYADGCTSGHAIMGISYFQIGSMVATASFFAGGLFLTHLLLPYILKAVLQ